LLYDVERFPNLGYTWGKHEQEVIEFEREAMVCSVAWQWYPRKEVRVLALCDMPGYDPRKWGNRSLMEAFAAELAKADVAVGHNITDFDDNVVNTDFVVNGINPPPPHRTIDTLRVLRSRFRFNSNRLEDACVRLGIGRKVPHPGFAMWKGCMRGDPKSWRQMKSYNVGDVDPLLRGLYEAERPWIRNHPNVTVGGSDGCPTCGHPDLKPWSWAYTQAGKYQRYVCKKCFSWCKGVVVRGAVVFRPV
jgi:hypothetical protein